MLLFSPALLQLVLDAVTHLTVTVWCSFAFGTKLSLILLWENLMMLMYDDLIELILHEMARLDLKCSHVRSVSLSLSSATFPLPYVPVFLWNCAVIATIHPSTRCPQTYSSHLPFTSTCLPVSHSPITLLVYVYTSPFPQSRARLSVLLICLCIQQPGPFPAFLLPIPVFWPVSCSWPAHWSFLLGFV